MTIACETYTLSNGLRVVLHRENALPVVCVTIAYHVGSRDEQPGRTGFAHLFEHLMFDGSANVPRGAFDRHCEQAGGYSNAYTVEDKTVYYEVLPANHLALGLWLESDRLLALSLTSEGLETQRSVVMEEKRQRVDNQPYGTWDERMAMRLYAGHPYGHTVIGSMDDIAAATMDDVTAFHSAYYRPNNAVLSIAGDFDPVEARDLIEHYFGSIPAGPVVPRIDARTWLPPGGHVEVVHDQVPLPAVFAAWRIPSERDPAFPSIDLLSDVLGNGDTSRLHHALVYEQQVASQSSAYVDAREDGGMFVVYAVANPGRTAGELEAAIDREIARLVAGGITEAEMTKTRNRMESSLYLHLQTVQARADRLAHFTVVHDDPALASTVLDRYSAVTAGDVHAAAAHLGTDQRVVLHYVPAAPSDTHDSDEQHDR